MRFLIFFLMTATAVCQQTKPYKISGETNYSQSQDKALGTELTGEYRVVIHEPKHKDYVVYLGGKVVLDYDHFGNEMKTNAFTTIGVDF
jgi:hypothetical protein